MNSKQSKKVRQRVRREARALWGEGLEALGALIRKRPTWCPRVLWILLYVPLFKWKTLKLFYRHL